MELKANPQRRSYRWLPLVTAVFVTSLIVSNIIAVKLVNIGGMYLPAAVILIPIAYIFGDILTEVYGYARARQVIWIGFFFNLIAVIAFLLGGIMPAAPFWTIGPYNSPTLAQQAYQSILGFTPRLLVASFIAYLCGDFLNSIVLAKLKVKTGGRFLWTRTISSTIIGEGIDSLIFMTIAYLGIFPMNDLGRAILSQWMFKVVFEVVATPLTYIIVNWLKKIEQEDYFDRDTDFNPIAF
jgi:queuosine precursor transporter